MMGLHTPSTSFCFSLNSSTSASWLASSHLMASSHLSLIAFLSSSLILSLTLSSSALNFSASLTILSISSLESLPLSLVIVIFVLSLELLSVTDHSFDLFLGKPSLVVGNRDLVLLASALVSRGHVEDTVGVNIKGHFDLGNTSRSRRNASEIELAQVVVVLGHGTLAFVHLDRHSGLVVAVGGEGLGLLGGNGGVPLDQGSHHTSG